MVGLHPRSQELCITCVTSENPPRQYGGVCKAFDYLNIKANFQTENVAEFFKYILAVYERLHSPVLHDLQSTYM